MRFYYAAALLGTLMMSATAKAANVPDPKTMADIVLVLADLTAQDAPRAIIDLNQTEMDWLVYRAAHPDNPHTPVTQDAVFVNTALALGYLANPTPAATGSKAISGIGQATQATLQAQAAVTSGPPPYIKPKLQTVQEVCKSIIATYN